MHDSLGKDCDAMDRPNIVYVLADDLGYGDLDVFEPSSKIPTPNLGRLAEQGMRFNDAHATSAVCSPSRYSLLTGRYNWRSRLKSGIVWDWDGPLIEQGLETVGSLLQGRGYRTACIGKWHLGWDWPTYDGKHANESIDYGAMDPESLRRRAVFGDRVDFTQRIGGGPVDRGFDSYFGVDVPNFPPYTWIEDDHVVQVPTTERPENMYGSPGPAVEGWRLEDMLPTMTERAVKYISQASQQEEPYFLFFALTAPHSPVIPSADFVGKSGIGQYGDFVCEVDAVMGRILAAVEASGKERNTLIVFASDNGPERETRDDEGVYNRARRTGHYSMGALRGMKRDVWEGGHRVPLLIAWPAVVPAGAVCDQLVSLMDLMATVGDITGGGLPPGAGEDSVSILPLLQGEVQSSIRDSLVLHGMEGTFALRSGHWVLVDSPTGAENPEPDWFRDERGYTVHSSERELFDLRSDLSERENLYDRLPKEAAELLKQLDDIRGDEVPLNRDETVSFGDVPA